MLLHTVEAATPNVSRGLKKKKKKKGKSFNGAPLCTLNICSVERLGIEEIYYWSLGLQVGE